MIPLETHVIRKKNESSRNTLFLLLFEEESLDSFLEERRDYICHGMMIYGRFIEMIQTRAKQPETRFSEPFENSLREMVQKDRKLLIHEKKISVKSVPMTQLWHFSVIKVQKLPNMRVLRGSTFKTVFDRNKSLYTISNLFLKDDDHFRCLRLEDVGVEKDSLVEPYTTAYLKLSPWDAKVE